MLLVSDTWEAEDLRLKNSSLVDGFMVVFLKFQNSYRGEFRIMSKNFQLLLQNFPS